MNRYTIFGYEWHMGEKKILSRVDPGGEWCQVSDVEAALATLKTDHVAEIERREREAYAKGFNSALDAFSEELEKAFGECDTLNLLHGAARVRSLKSKEVK
jgi:hypothetical protein